jgi:TP901-1 family phage major tail protein
MGAQKGKDLLLKAGDGAGGFTTVMGLRTRSLSFSAATVDVTDADSDGGWRELLSGGGIRRAAVAGAGVFKDAASDSLAQALFFSGEVRDWQVVVPGFGTLAGPFQITSLGYAGDYQGEVTFNLALESAGAISFTAGA